MGQIQCNSTAFEAGQRTRLIRPKHDGHLFCLIALKFHLSFSKHFLQASSSVPGEVTLSEEDGGEAGARKGSGGGASVARDLAKGPAWPRQASWPNVSGQC